MGRGARRRHAWARIALSMASQGGCGASGRTSRPESGRAGSARGGRAGANFSVDGRALLLCTNAYRLCTEPAVPVALQKLIVGLIFIVFIVDDAITRTSISREYISIAATFVAIVIASLPSSSQPLVADVIAFFCRYSSKVLGTSAAVYVSAPVSHRRRHVSR